MDHRFVQSRYALKYGAAHVLQIWQGPPLPVDASGPCAARR
ncbi:MULTISPECIES: hypothetical protein [Achromobacter]